MSLLVSLVVPFLDTSVSAKFSSSFDSSGLTYINTRQEVRHTCTGGNTSHSGDPSNPFSVVGGGGTPI